MKTKHATLLGFLAASLVPSAYFAVGFFLLSGYWNPYLVLSAFVGAFVFSAPATIILGVPAFLAMNKYKLVTWWSMGCCGALVGMTVVLVLDLANGVDFKTLWKFAIPGSLAGLTFWVFWSAGRTHDLVVKMPGYVDPSDVPGA